MATHVQTNRDQNLGVDERDSPFYTLFMLISILRNPILLAAASSRQRTSSVWAPNFESIIKVSGRNMRIPPGSNGSFFLNNKRHSPELGVDVIRRLLCFLAEHENAARSTQNQALSALLFSYRKVLSINLPRIDELTHVLNEASSRGIHSPADTL